MIFGNLGLGDIVTMTVSLLQGVGVVFTLFAVTLPVSMVIGFFLTLCTRSRVAPLRWLVNAYIYVIRGTPLMLQLFFVYFGFPLLSKRLVLSGLVSALIGYTFNYAAYFAEIFRGGLISVDKGQYEACQVLGLNRVQTTVRVILPQMFRVALPSITNESITLIKDTALVFAIAVPEVMHYAKVAVSRTGTVFPFIIAAVIYLILNTALQFAFKQIEKKMAY